MPATLRLDHVVIRVYDLAAAIADYTSLGFTVIPGGEHPGIGSRNALIAFEDDTYLELIAFGSKPPEGIVPRRVRFQELAGRPPTERHWLPWASAPEGLVDFALSPANIVETLATVRSHGQHWDGPLPGSRLRPDGQQVAWQLGLSERLAMPFLCADVTTRDLRVPTGVARRHSNAVVGIHGVIIAVVDVEATKACYRDLLGVPWAEKTELGFSEPAQIAEFVCDDWFILLAQPTTNSGDLATHLEQRGEGPFELRLVATDVGRCDRLTYGPNHGVQFCVSLAPK